MTTIDRDGVVPAAGVGWGWIVAYGVISILVGLLAFAQPLAATLVATTFVALLFVIVGVAALAASWRAPEHSGRGYGIAFGIISIVAGVLAFLFPVGGALSLTLIIAAWLAVRGLTELSFAFRHRFGRGWMLALGIVNLGLAIYVWAMLPFSAVALPGVVLAISFLLGGVNALVSGLAHKSGTPAFALPR